MPVINISRPMIIRKIPLKVFPLQTPAAQFPEATAQMVRIPAGAATKTYSAIVNQTEKASTQAVIPGQAETVKSVRQAS